MQKNTLTTIIVIIILIILGVLIFGGDGADVPATTNPDLTEETANNEVMGPTIVDLAQSNEDLSTLVTAVAAAELVDTLNSEGDFTVFAPTNDAFAELPEGTVDTLLMPENQTQLQDVLTYHVVPGTLTASDLSDGQELETVQGETLMVSVDADGNVMINDAMVIAADVDASNGVVHVIDMVLMPTDA